jgi:transposase
VRGRQLLARLGLPEPWQGTLKASLRLIDELDRKIGDCERELRRLGADHRYVPLLCTVPGVSWVLAYTIAAELGDINRFPHTGHTRRLHRPLPTRLPIRRTRPTWPARQAGTALSPLGAGRGRHPHLHRPRLRDRYQQTKARIGKQRGAKVAQIDPARRLTEAIWHMLTRNQPFAPKGATDPLAA